MKQAEALSIKEARESDSEMEETREMRDGSTHSGKPDSLLPM